MKYRYLGDSGLLVSRICLGTMTYAMKDWGCDLDVARALTRKFVDAGGNFFDTADMYSTGGSEEMLAETISGLDRDDLVLATKCWFRMRPSANAKGLSRKHIMEAAEASLRRLRTDYIDLYQVHGPDPFTRLEEVMRALDDLVRTGKVRYIGCSNFFGWQIAKANGISERMGLEKFVSGQHLYNLLRRDIEREVLPACADQGLGMLCWAPLASGLLTGKYDREKGPSEGTRIGYRAEIDMPRYWSDDSFRIVDECVAIGREHGRSASQVALAWLLHDPRVTAIIAGVRTEAQLEDNLGVSDWDLTDADHERLTNLVGFNLGYPQEWIGLTFWNIGGMEEFARSR
ncbi:MAG: aldo/keto reductase [Phycisphaeraceae bacterium]|nr:aldo/keto reductase [Phycisphaeraceae bacterium]